MSLEERTQGRVLERLPKELYGRGRCSFTKKTAFLPIPCLSFHPTLVPSNPGIICFFVLDWEAKVALIRFSSLRPHLQFSTCSVLTFLRPKATVAAVQGLAVRALQARAAVKALFSGRRPPGGARRPISGRSSGRGRRGRGGRETIPKARHGEVRRQDAG